MPKFKVGDRVVIARNSPKNCGYYVETLDAEVGGTGIVEHTQPSICANNAPAVRVKLDRNSVPWNFPEESVELANPAIPLHKHREKFAKLLERGILQAYAAGKPIYVHNGCGTYWTYCSNNNLLIFDLDPSQYSLEPPAPPEFQIGAYIVKVDENGLQMGCLRIPKFSASRMLEVLGVLSPNYWIEPNDLIGYQLTLVQDTVHLKTSDESRTRTVSKTRAVELCDWLKKYHNWS